MLQKMGWKENSGLGKNADGITNAVKLKANHEGIGLGSIKDDGAGNLGWSATAASFNDVLEILKKSYSKPVKSKKNTKKGSIVKIGIKYVTTVIKLRFCFLVTDEFCLSTYYLNYIVDTLLTSL